MEPLVDTLRPFAEALPSGLSKRRRDTLAKRVLVRYAEGVDGMRELLDEFVEHTLSRVGGFGSPGSYTFHLGEATHLRGQARGFTRALTLYHNGRILPAEVVEIAHTAASQFLMAALGPLSKRWSFQRRAREAAAAGHMSDKCVDSLLTLNSVRRRVKHQGQRVRAVTLDAFLMDVVNACHQLTRAVRASSGDETEGFN